MKVAVTISTEKEGRSKGREKQTRKEKKGRRTGGTETQVERTTQQQHIQEYWTTIQLMSGIK
jgi:hypothetical protein